MRWRGGLAVLLVGLMSLVGAPLAVVALTSAPAGAVTMIIVANSNDSGTGSLRQAFLDADSGGPDGGADVEIVVPGTVGPITLTSGPLTYDGGNSSTQALTLTGGGNTILQQTSDARVINDTATTLFTLNGLTITGGHTTAGNAGAGILVQGSAVVTNSIITGNTSGDAVGGIRVSNGPLTLTDSTISHNTATGDAGGAFVNGAVTVTNSTIDDNMASTAVAGGIEAVGAASLTGSTVSGNTSSNNGGGVFGDAAVTVTNSTISGNDTSGGSGGGIFAEGPITLVYATVVSNDSAGGGSNVDGHGTSSLTSFASVLALPGPDGGAENCGNLTGTTSHGFNLEDDAGASCGFSTGTADLAPGTSPDLGALANNGGPTLTQLPQSGSPVIDAIPVASCQADGASGITTDQRGLARPSGAGCDVGAVEIQIAAAAVVTTPAFTG